jgi:hypothetical protein
MLSAFAQRLSPAILRQNGLLYTAFKVIAASQSRSFMATPLAKEKQLATPSQSRELPKDQTWGEISDYAKKMAPPRVSPEETWRQRSDKIMANPPPSVYAGSLPLPSHIDSV